MDGSALTYAAGPGVTSGTDNIIAGIGAGIVFLLAMMLGLTLTGGKHKKAVTIIASVLAGLAFFAVAFLPDINARGF